MVPLSLSLQCRLLTWLLLTAGMLDVSADNTASTKPNIIFMFGDDLGFNELGYLGCTETSTPNIDSLATDEGLILWTNYVSKICSPSRSAFLSGRYPSTLGLQNLVFNTQYPVSLTRQVSILSEEFKAAGYTTHMIGKWHLGYTSYEYTPTYRGFDTFSGYLGGLVNYFNKSQCMPSQSHPDSPLCYYDLRMNEYEDWDNVQKGQFGTFLQRDQTLKLLESQKDATDPFFLYLGWQSSHEPDVAPDEYIEQYHDSGEVTSRHYCQAQTTALDDSIGEVVDYLKASGLWDNTLIVFSSDNGGVYNRHDNSPLRGFKNSSFEGGIRVPAFVTGGYLDDDRKGLVEKDLMVSVVDWYPTLLSAAGIEPQYYRSMRLYDNDSTDTRFVDNGVGTVPLDGQDVWSAIQFGDVAAEISVDHRELLLDLDAGGICSFSSCGAIRKGQWKFIRGENMGVNSSSSDGNQWLNDFSTCEDDLLGCSEVVISDEALTCHLRETGCLFNIAQDSCEHMNVGGEYPKVRAEMSARLDYYQSVAATILINAGSDMPETWWDPSYSDSEFWGPYFNYDQVDFEDTLTTFYAEMYPADSDSDTDTATMKKMDRMSAEVMELDGGKGDGNVANQFVESLVTVMATMVLTACALLVVRRYCRSVDSKAVDEVAPLLSVTTS